MSSFVTQCPHCRTSFRVSAAQLAAARGVVRCGACMELFNAARHLADDSARPAASPGAAVAPPDADSPARARPPRTDDSTFWIHDDLDLDNLDLDEELAKLERLERAQSRAPLELDVEPLTPPHAADADRESPDEADHAGIPETGPVPAPSSSEQEQEPEVAGVAPAAVAPFEHFTPVSASHPAPPSPLASPPGRSPDALTAERREPAIDALAEIDEPPRPLGPPSLAVDLDEQERPAPHPHGEQERLLDLDDEPLQLEWQARRRPWGRWLGWGALNLIALLALGAQYLAYNFDGLARQAAYRPWFERLCPVVGCTLPPMVDISQIKSSNLVVRSHPDFAGALVVDAIIYNRAPFAQPFPLLEIRFDDLQGQTLARRTFKPGEYLSGELAGQREMPSQIPIHIALDILDPGARATNYSLSFRSPE